jgi:hypothetical protein
MTRLGQILALLVALILLLPGLCFFGMGVGGVMAVLPPPVGNVAEDVIWSLIAFVTSAGIFSLIVALVRYAINRPPTLWRSVRRRPGPRDPPSGPPSP